MKITKKMEAEIKYAMNDYWESYLSGNLDHWASYLVNDYKNIGTTEAEIWNSKKEIYDYSISVLDQMVGFTELRNKKTEIIPYDPYIMVHEYLDIYIKVEEKWIFYSKLRLSSLIQKIDNTWKILHQHGSYPDSKVMDGEFFAFDTLKSENLKLQKAVKDRTEELEKTNRTLEIETSLERVRAIALSMKEPADMLEVCKVISNQLQLLGIKDIRNVQTAIFNRSNKTYINYEYYKLHDKELITEIDYTIHPKQMEWANEMLKSSDTFFATSFSRNELTEWVENQRKSSQFVDSYLQKAESLNYYYYSIGPVAIGMSTYTPLNVEDLRIFKKFKNVFELSYKRFIDIEKAEAQAREAQIEAALERVRSRSMAMQKSEELKEVIRVIYDQFIQLNINIEHTGFIVDYKIRDDMHIWLADKNGPLSEIIFPYFDSPHWNSFIDAKEKGLNFFANHLNFEEKNKFYKKLFTFIPDLPEEAKKFYFNCPGLAISTVLLENVGLYIENFSGTIYSDEENKILMRFGKVFQQTYTRFLDLQKAEAQARESEIELALERVRARTMAMQHSNELADASFLLDSQIRALGIKTRGCAFNIYGENESSEWFSSEMGTMPMYKTPRENVFLRYYEEGQKGKQMYIESFAGDVCAAHYDYLCTLPIMGESLKKFKESGGSFPTQQIDHATYFKYGYLLFITLEPVPEAHEIFKRFAKVFEQTYTRFLDLQKAEAQAREAQIEAALERVRSSAMAMHKSDEVGTVSDMLFSELNKLNFDLNGCSLVVIDEEKDKMELWRARSNIAVKPFASTSFSKSMELLKKYMPDWYTTFIKALGKRKNYLTDELSEDRRSLFINAIAEQYQYSDTEKPNWIKTLS
ncbi:MAG: nuclear transport factor 2 family protein [Ignavibacteriales bacterium]|nr:nuclear transport factor 2 family protein [Ignavibacteriales bacterium]